MEPGKGSIYFRPRTSRDYSTEVRGRWLVEIVQDTCFIQLSFTHTDMVFEPALNDQYELWLQERDRDNRPIGVLRNAIVQYAGHRKEYYVANRFRYIILFSHNTNLADWREIVFAVNPAPPGSDMRVTVTRNRPYKKIMVDWKKEGF